MTEASKERTRLEWRALGFFYDRDDDAKEWLFVGSRHGLRGLSRLLRAFAADPRNQAKSEHEHYGPYAYLEVMTWPEAGVDGHTIHGPLPELERLAALFDEKISNLESGQRARIHVEFAAASEYALVLEVRDDAFDPASADESLATG